MSQGPAPERRRGDRRATDRRAAAPEESWFGALGVEGDTGFHDDTAQRPRRRGSDRPDAASAPGLSREMSREARRVATSTDTALRRIWRTYAAARAALGLALLMLHGSALVLGNPLAPVPLGLSLAYAVQAVALWAWPRVVAGATEPSEMPLSKPRWLASIGVDLLAFALLHLWAPVAPLNYAALLVLPVLAAGVLTARLPALGVAAAATLLLLLAAVRQGAAGADLAVPLLQGGLGGVGLFAVALLAGELSGRLAREQLAARGSLELARQQAQLNRLVIEEMAEGVLVVDRGNRVRAANPAARELLAPQGRVQPLTFALDEQPAWAGLAGTVQRAFAAGLWPGDAHELTLEFDDGNRRTLQLRARFTRRRSLDADESPPEEFCVLFLEDLRTVQARMRQDKLAAMGRVSAGIAHEIRNPLAAIAQANALLMEDELPATQRRLSGIVADNVERLKRIVDDVMEVAPGAAPQSMALDAAAQVAAWCADWSRTARLPLGAGSKLQVALPAQPLGVQFDPEHLRRVVVNLLDNAHRHAADAPGAVQLTLAPLDAQHVLLSVASAGEPIPPEVERHLFEPFFSTRSRGTGLGLYICRELCERHGARIDYRLRPAGQRHRNEFIVVMPRAPLAEQQTRLHP